MGRRSKAALAGSERAAGRLASSSAKPISHSPRVPSVEECRDLLERAVDALGVARLWANPDCGLKTRRYEETRESLKNLVEATARVRSAHAQD